MAVQRESVTSERFATIPLFAVLDPDERARVAEFFAEIEVPAGATIQSERDFAYEFCVIEEGRAEVVRDGRRLAELGPGDFFGEIGLLVTGRRTASVISLTPMRLLAMFDQPFRRMERELPSFAEAVRAACAERFARM